MANDNFPRGLFPVNYPFIPIHYYRVATNNNVFLGEVVDLTSTGYVSNAIDVTTAGVVQALGVVVGFAGVNKKGLVGANDPFLRAADLTTLATGLETGDRWVAVADDPQQLFIVQGDTGGTLATLAAQGECAALIYRGGGSGNTQSGWANLELDASTNSTGSGQLVQLIQLHDNVNTDGTNNTAGANFAKWIVKFMTHRKSGVANVSPAV